MQKQTTYQQLQPEDRITIASMRQRGIGVRAIARTLERAPSTIARELARNTTALQDYGSHHAQLRAAACRRHAYGSGKLHVQSVCWGVVKTMLGWKWSPQQISATLRRVCPHQREFQVSHETIYTAIYDHARGTSTSSEQESQMDLFEIFPQDRELGRDIQLQGDTAERNGNTTTL
jgi:IS30 family transposase